MAPPIGGEGKNRRGWLAGRGKGDNIADLPASNDHDDVPTTEMPTTEMPSVSMHVLAPTPIPSRHRVGGTKPHCRESSNQHRHIHTSSSKVSPQRQIMRSHHMKQLPTYPENTMVDDGYHNHEDFTNMIIECNNSDSEDSFGDITFDGSIVNEQYYRNRHAPQRQKKPGYSDNQYRLNNNDPSRRNKVLDTMCETSSRSSQSQYGSIDEQEKALLELAMERSLMDCPSATSTKVSNQTLPSLANNKRFNDVESPGRASRRVSNVNSSGLAGSGCHLAMLGGGFNTKSRSSSTTSSGTVATRETMTSSNTDSAGLAGSGCHLAMLGGGYNPREQPNGQSSSSNVGKKDKFYWKREGKKWLKVPIKDTDDENLHSIDEERYLRGINNDHRTGPSSLSDMTEEQLERMEQELINEALTRSMSSIQHSVGSRSNCGSLDPHVSSSGSATSDHGMISNSVQRSMHESNRSGSYTQSKGQRRWTRPARSNDLAGAGCHLAMVGRATQPKRLNVIEDYGEDDEEQVAEQSYGRERRNGDCAGQNSAGVNLVWKKGPNNTWGKFPETQEDIDERMLQEALELSRQEAARHKSIRGR